MLGNTVTRIAAGLNLKHKALWTLGIAIKIKISLTDPQVELHDFFIWNQATTLVLKVSYICKIFVLKVS